MADPAALASGGIVPPPSGRYLVAEPDPPGFLVPRDPPRRSEALANATVAYLGAGASTSTRRDHP